MITHVPAPPTPEVEHQNQSDEIGCRDRLVQGSPGRDRTIRRWSPLLPGSRRYRCATGLNEVERAPPCATESEPLAPAITLSATNGDVPPLAGCLLLGGGSAPSANSLTINNVWTRRGAMTGKKRDGGRRRTRARYTEAYKRERRRQGWGWVVLMAGVVIGLTHVITHLGQLRFLPSAGWQDLAVGYPMAMVLALIGFMMIASRTG